MEERRKNNLELHEFLEEIKEEVSKTIKVTVNGKIDRLREDIKKHKVETDIKFASFQPIIDAYKATNTLGKGVVWSAKIIISIGIVAGGIITFFKYLR